MTGPVVPTPPAEVAAELAAELRRHSWSGALVEAIAEDLAPLVERMVAERVQAEVLRYQFAPMGDNHHNAFMCPYCSPQLQAERDAAAERVRAARDEALREAERRIEDAAIEQTEGVGDPTGALFRTAMGRAARIVAELREATP